MKTISNVVIEPNTANEKIAAKRILANHGFIYEDYGDCFEIYENLAPREWSRILEEIEQETKTIEREEDDKEIIEIRAYITQRLLNCTPRELQHVLDVIHSWKADFGDTSAERIETVREIIDLLSRPEYIQEIDEEETYFKTVFGL